jgi:hypothetical protein
MSTACAGLRQKNCDRAYSPPTSENVRAMRRARELKVSRGLGMPEAKP